MAKNPLRRLTPAPAGAPVGPGTAEARPAGLAVRIHDILHSNATLGPAIVLLIAVVYFSATTERFLEPANLSLIVQQVMVVGTLGIAQTLIILTAGIDLSVGAIMVLSSIVMAKLSADEGVPGVLALLVGFGVGTACGLINGLLVTRLRLPPFIVTLGTLNVFIALNLWYSESATIRGTDMPDLLLWTGNTIDVGDTKITYGSLIMLALFGVFAWVLKNTAWGRHVYAVGDDAEAARLVGVLRNGLTLTGVDVLWQDFAVGVLIIAAVAIDQWIRKVKT